MLRYLIMLGACVLVSGAMLVTLRLFFRKLRRIEEERWGKQAAFHPELVARQKKRKAVEEKT